MTRATSLEILTPFAVRSCQSQISEVLVAQLQSFAYSIRLRTTTPLQRIFELSGKVMLEHLIMYYLEDKLRYVLRVRLLCNKNSHEHDT